MNHYTVPALVGAVAQKYPRIRIDCSRRVFSGKAVSALLNGQVDLVFTGLPMTSPEIDTVSLSKEPHYVLCPVDHWLVREQRHECTLKELAEEEFICLPSGQGSTLRRDLEEATQRLGFCPRISYEVADSSMVMFIVAQKLGVALIPECLRRIKPHTTRAIIVRDAPALYSAIAWRRNDDSPVLQTILTYIREKYLHTIAAHQSCD